MKVLDSVGKGVSVEKHDEFLRAPWLFKYGPLLLFVGSLLVSSCFFGAALWRVKEGRQGVLDATFKLTATTATLAEDNLSGILNRLSQANLTIASNPMDLTLGHAALEKRLGFSENTVQVVALDKNFRLMSGKDASLLNVSPLLREKLSSLQPNSVKFLSAEYLNFGAPASFYAGTSLTIQGQPHYIVYVLNSEALKTLTKKLFGMQPGWLAVYLDNGTPLLDTSFGAVTSSLRSWEVPSGVVSSTSDDIDSSLVSVLHSTKEFTVYAGISAPDAFKEFSKRVTATWQIATISSLIVIGLSCLTGFALINFERKESNLRKMATIDLLTGLPNRRSFQQLLDKALNKKLRPENGLVALLFIDLDDFKYVNDTAGHATGDLLLKNVAALLQESVRDGDRVCRLGGDEFTVLLENLESINDAKLAGKRILQKLSRSISCGALDVIPNASVGIAVCQAGEYTPEEMLRRADTAMYQAKNLGKNQCVVYDEAMTERVKLRATAVKELTRAIKKEELSLVYQPKFNAKTGELTGFEALSRWNHPTRGQVSPAEFIPLAEETGLICDLGNWALRTAIQQIKIWHGQGHGWMKVAVNVSALQLKEKDLVQFVSDTLLLYQVPGEFLQIELTESSLAKDPENTQLVMHQLRCLNVSTAIDDFGTGYSSLGALQTFEIDWLKVDRSFVNAISTDQGLAICKAIVVMGHALGMHVIAEGVETLEQKKALRALGCDELQGFLLGRPVPADQAVHSKVSHLRLA